MGGGISPPAIHRVTVDGAIPRAFASLLISPLFLPASSSAARMSCSSVTKEPYKIFCVMQSFFLYCCA